MRLTQLPVHPAALDAQQHAQVEGGPVGVGPAAVGADAVPAHATQPVQHAQRRGDSWGCTWDSGEVEGTGRVLEMWAAGPARSAENRERPLGLHLCDRGEEKQGTKSAEQRGGSTRFRAVASSFCRCVRGGVRFV